jgi:hypothetical protein
VQASKQAAEVGCCCCCHSNQGRKYQPYHPKVFAAILPLVCNTVAAGQLSFRVLVAQSPQRQTVFANNHVA